MKKKEGKNMFKSKLQRNLTCVVFAVYLALLAWLVLFKFAISPGDIVHMRAANLIPFYYDTEVNPLLHLKETGYNVLVFVPLGVYACIFLPHCRLLQKALPAFFLSLLFEVIQYVFAIGATDITDLIANTAGGLAGIGLFYALRALFPKKYLAVVNGVGAAIEICAVMLLGIVIAANR